VVVASSREDETGTIVRVRDDGMFRDEVEEN